MKLIGHNSFLSRALAISGATSAALFIVWPSLGLATGAVSGGGGGTLPANPVSVYQVERVVREGFREMRLIARELSRRQRRGAESTLDHKLFSGPKTLVDVLEETGYEVRLDKPCLDRDGNEVDASVFSAHPDDICISAFRIAPKVIDERVRIETLALVFHELSHKLNTTEAEAIELQKEAAFYLGLGNPKSLDLPTTWMFGEYASEVKKNLNLVADTLERKNTSGISNSTVKNQVDQLLKEVVNFSSAIRPKVPYSYYTRRQFEYVGWLEIRLDILRNTLLAKYDEQPDYWQKQIDELFNGATVITYGDFLRIESPRSYSGNDFENNILLRLDSDSLLLNELRSLAAAFELESGFLFQIGSNLAIHKHAADGLDLQFNPFIKFIGKYKLSNVVCSSSSYENPEGRIPLEIELTMGSSGRPGDVDLKKSWTSMRTTDLLRENGTTILGGTVVRLGGSDNPSSKSAEALGVYGTPWGDRHDRHTTRIEERSDGLYFVDNYVRRERLWSGPIESGYHCEARLL